MSLFLLRAGWKPDEIRLVFQMFAHSFLFGFAYTLLETIADAMFLTQFGAKALPYAYMAGTVLTVMAALTYARLESYTQPARLFLLVVAILAALLAAARLGFVFIDARYMSVALRVSCGLIYLLMELEFWSLAGTLFTLRQGKRVFPLIGAGEVLAGVVGGLTVTAFSDVVNLPNLLYIALVAMAGNYLLVRRILRGHAKLKSHGPTQAPDEGEGFSLATLLRSRYQLLILAVYGLFTFAWYLADFAFYQQVDARFAQEESELAGFLGSFFAVTSVVHLITQVLVSGWLLTRFGIRVGLLALPLLLTAGAVALTVLGLRGGSVPAIFWVMAITKLGETVLTKSLQEPSVRILYQPLPTRQRLGLQAFVEGTFGAAIAGLAGVFLLLCTRWFTFTAVQAAWVLLGVAILWIPLTIALSRAYGRVLQESLARRTVAAEGLNLDDHSSRAIIDQWLTSTDPVEVLYALHVLGDESEPALLKHYVALLQHPAPQVRRAALERIERNQLSATTNIVAAMVDRDPVPAVQGAALRTMLALGESDVLEQALPYLRDSQPELQKGALIGMLRHGGIEGVLAAGSELMERVRSDRSADRALAAEVLGQVGATSFYRPLLPLLEDYDPIVRTAALRAAAAVANPALCPALITNLRLANHRPLAVAALSAIGNSAVASIESALTKTQDRWEQVTLLKTLRRVPGERSIRALKRFAEHADAGLRREALHGLAWLKYRASDGDREYWIKIIYRECRSAVDALAARADLAEIDPAIDRALNIEVKRALENTMLVLTLLYDTPALQDARAHLDADAADKRALAVEILDHLLSRDLQERILPLVEDIPVVARLSRLQTHFPHQLIGQEARLRQVLEDEARRTPWTKTCACYYVGQNVKVEYHNSVARHCDHGEAYLRETALWAFARLEAGPCS
jgi:ATP/ADP translocase